MENGEPKIAFYDTKDYYMEAFSEANEDMELNFGIEFFDFNLDERTAICSKGFDVVCAYVNDNLNDKAIKILKECGVKLIALRGIGYNNVDLKSAAREQIKVVRVPSYSPYSIAEHAASLLLSLTRKIPQAYARALTGNFSAEELVGRNLHGLTAGIIGTGKIGKICAELLSGLGMRIELFDVAQDKDWSDRRGFKYVPLRDLFAESDVISLHCSLTEETKHIINENSLAFMKKDVIVINTSRVALIDTKALIKVLKKQLIGGIGIDIYEEESKYFVDDLPVESIEEDVLERLMTFPNVIITNHQAFLTEDSLKIIAETTLENIKAWKLGEKLENELKLDQ